MRNSKEEIDFDENKEEEDQGNMRDSYSKESSKILYKESNLIESPKI